MKAAVIGSADLESNGGAEINVIQMANVLSQLGYEVTVFGSGSLNNNNSNNIDININYRKDAFKYNIFANEFILKHTNGISMGLIGLFSFKNIYENIKGFDLYYFVNPNFLFGKTIKYLLRDNKHPEVILGNHGTYFELFHRKYFSRMLIPILNHILFKDIKRYKIKTQVQNTFQKEFYQRLGFPSNSIYTIPQCNINFNNYKISKKESFNVISINNLTKDNGYGLLKKLIKNSGNLNLHILGYSEDLDKIKNRFSRYENVKFYGYLAEKEKSKLLSECDVILNLSKYESLSVSSIEGLASGLYLIGNNISGSSQIKNNINEAELLEKENVKNYLNSIEKIKNFKNNDIEAYYENRKIIREKAKQYFDKSVIENDLRDLIIKEPLQDNKISIVTASLNERGNISKWLNGIINLINEKNLNQIDEIVIVDDGSNDGTLEIIENYKQRDLPVSINLIKREEKMGTVNAQITGAKYAKNPYLIILDCDLQHPVKYIYDFVNAFNYGYDIVIGSRYMEGGKTHWTYQRELISRTASIMAYMIFPSIRKIKDPLSGYFMVKKDMISGLYPYKFMYKPLLYTLIFNPKDRNYLEIPISMEDRKDGNSKIVYNYQETVVLYTKELLTYYKMSLRKSAK